MRMNNRVKSLSKWNWFFAGTLSFFSNLRQIKTFHGTNNFVQLKVAFRSSFFLNTLWFVGNYWIFNDRSAISGLSKGTKRRHKNRFLNSISDNPVPESRYGNDLKLQNTGVSCFIKLCKVPFTFQLRMNKRLPRMKKHLKCKWENLNFYWGTPFFRFLHSQITNTPNNIPQERAIVYLYTASKLR